MARLSSALRELHLLRGAPSTRKISADISSELSPISHTTVHQVLQGKVRSRWDTIERIVIYLEGNVGQFKELWLDAQRPSWKKSSFSPAMGTGIEVAYDAESGLVLVQDAKDPNRPEIRFTPTEWRAFLAGAVNGEFDLE